MDGTEPTTLLLIYLCLAVTLGGVETGKMPLNSSLCYRPALHCKVERRSTTRGVISSPVTSSVLSPTNPTFFVSSISFVQRPSLSPANEMRFIARGGLSETRREAHKFASGFTRSGKKARPKYLGIKRQHNQWVGAGEILVRQRGREFRAGPGTYLARDYTIQAKVAGAVVFKGNTVSITSNPIPRNGGSTVEILSALWKAPRPVLVPARGNRTGRITGDQYARFDFPY